MGKRLMLRPILVGIITTIVLLFTFSLLLTIILHFTSVHEAAIRWFLVPITLLTLFIGGCTAGYKSGSRGWWIGGITGLGFLFLTWLISFLGFDMYLSLKQLTLYGAYLLLSIFGGIVGVNMSPKRYE